MVISGVFYYLYRTSQKKVQPGDQDFFKLRMQKAYLYGGIFFLAIGLSAMVIPFVIRDFSPGLLFSLTGTFIILGGIGFYMVMLYCNHWVAFNHEMMVVQNAWGNSTAVFFQNIENARYNSFTGAVAVYIQSGKKVSVHEHLAGFPQILQEIRKVNAPALKNIFL